MSSERDRSGLSARSVTEYLRRHPEFFQEHAEWLGDLHIPHVSGSGGTVSLIERQVMVLREENRRARDRLVELTEHARQNEKIGNRMHDLAVELIEAHSLEDTVDAVYRVLRDEFHMDAVSLRLIADPAEAVLSERLTVSAGAPGLDPVQRTVQQRRPLCGVLPEPTLTLLFADRSPYIGSAALVPFRAGGHDGLLAIGSYDKERFHAHMGTLFLTRLAELVSTALHARLTAHRA